MCLQTTETLAHCCGPPALEIRTFPLMNSCQFYDFKWKFFWVSVLEQEGAQRKAAALPEDVGHSELGGGGGQRPPATTAPFWNILQITYLAPLFLFHIESF